MHDEVHYDGGAVAVLAEGVVAVLERAPVPAVDPARFDATLQLRLKLRGCNIKHGQP